MRLSERACALLIFVTWAVTASSSAHAVPIETARRAVVRESLRYLNTPYLWGGTRPDTGMDCSAFVQQVFHDVGLGLPRNSQGQFSSTFYLRPRQVHPGDLIFFAMKNPGTAQVDHVGIYVGRGYFIAASTSQGVHIESLRSSYYRARLVSVRKYPGF